MCYFWFVEEYFFVVSDNFYNEIFWEGGLILGCFIGSENVDSGVCVCEIFLLGWFFGLG